LARELALSAASTSDVVCVVLDAATIHSGISNLKPEISHLRIQISERDSERVDKIQTLDFIRSVESKGIKVSVLILNKCDLLEQGKIKDVTSLLNPEFKGPVVPVSALRGDGIEQLRDVLGAALRPTHTTVMSDSILFNDRQRTCVAAALESMTRAAALAEESDSTSQCADLLAFELREALDALGEVTGEVTTEDLLTQIFANFCIGK
jgi:tRNA modification GTPase